MSTKNSNPYVPSFILSSIKDTKPKQLTFADILGTNSLDKTGNISSTSSFKYDPINTPLKSTQQLNVDWSEFQNHTFFSSAEVKVNVAFDQIINGFPFDGTKKEVESFIEKLSGFEKWVFDQFPRNGGQLHFSGTQINEDPNHGFAEKLGTWIEVHDAIGKNALVDSKLQTGDAVLYPPVDSSFTIETHVFLPDVPNQTQVIFQKRSDDLLQGFALHINPSLTENVVGVFSITSGNVRNKVEAPLKKGKFNHICVSLNREIGNNYLQFFVDEELIAESKKEKNIEGFNDRSSFFIGSGSSFYSENDYIVPLQTFSGTLDEFRVFHGYRSVQQQKSYSSKGLYSNDQLKLYYRFNEPPTLLSENTNDLVNSILLDSSGNSLHSYIENFSLSLRESSKNSLNPMVNERSDFKIVLFPHNQQVQDLNNRLLLSASLYDQENPNTITKLIPRHYLREGAAQQGFNNTSVEGNIGSAYGTEGAPGQGKLGSVQIMLTFLYIWAKFFDEIKMFVDAFKTLRTVEYSSNETTPDNFLYDFVKTYGFYLPPLFNSADLMQYSDGENEEKPEISNFSLKNVQSQILRRILVNIPDIIRSKGTQHAIKSFLRSVGIDPNAMRIREFGGPSTRVLGSLRETKTEIVHFINFSTSSLVTTPFLSSSRVEPGYPEIRGTFINGISDFKSDGLLTSGSWTYEGFYRYAKENIAIVNDPQSLVRFETTGSLVQGPNILLNVVATPTELQAFVRPGMNFSSPSLSLKLNANVLDGEMWNISIGCFRNDSIDSNASSYFLRAATKNEGEVFLSYSTSSFFIEDSSDDKNAFRILDPLLNSSGTRISIGNSEEINEGNIGYYFLNNTVENADISRSSKFFGQVSNVRFWSKALTEIEWKEHVRNHRSFGVEDPTTNYNFVKNKSGSFERLRLSLLEKQANTVSDAEGKVEFIDFSKNDFFSMGTGFPAQSNVVRAETSDYSYFSPYFDEFSSNDKIRIRSYQNEENLKYDAGSTLSPVYSLPAGETPLDDPRFSIEFSLIDTLNKDIISMFATLDSIAEAVGNSALLYSPDYPELEHLRNIYFNRLSEKINFRSFFEFYRWFDSSISTMISQLVPRKTRFKGVNFVIESHMLERHKIEYQSSEIYLGDTTRSRIRDVLLSQQIVGNVGRY